MSKAKIIAAAGAFAVAALAIAATSPSALADTPRPTCHRVNPYVACTHGLKLKTLSPVRAHREYIYHTVKLTKGAVALTRLRMR